MGKGGGPSNPRRLRFFSFNNRPTPRHLSFLTVKIFAGTVWTPFNSTPFAVPYRSTVNYLVMALGCTRHSSSTLKLCTFE